MTGVRPNGGGLQVTVRSRPRGTGPSLGRQRRRGALRDLFRPETELAQQISVGVVV